MGPPKIMYLLHNFPNLNSWIILFFFFCGPFGFELDKFDCTDIAIPKHSTKCRYHFRFVHHMSDVDVF